MMKTENSVHLLAVQHFESAVKLALSQDGVVEVRTVYRLLHDDAETVARFEGPWLREWQGLQKKTKVAVLAEIHRLITSGMGCIAGHARMKSMSREARTAVSRIGGKARWPGKKSRR